MMEMNSGGLVLAFPSDRELVMTRVFNAPRELLFTALTRPEHVRRWYGRREDRMTVCEIDLRVGGRWRFVVQAEDGIKYAFSGVYKEIVPPERIVFTEGLEAMPGHDYVVTSTFVEKDGKTTLTNHILYKSRADRDGHVGSGMEAGASETYARLEEHLEVMARSNDPQPNLGGLVHLVGTWAISGGVEGTVTYEWMEGEFFLVQTVDLHQYGQHIKGIEIIGRLQPFGEPPGQDIMSRFYDNQGNTLDYVYEVDGETLIIWGGERGSPAYYRGTFSSDGNTISGRWVYPDGGGYESTMTRI